MQKRGRPAAKARRDRQLGLRFTAAEAAAIEAAAERSGLRPVAWVRQTAVAAAGAGPPPQAAEQLAAEARLAELAAQIRRAGVLLNQLLRGRHPGASVDAGALQAAVAAVEAAARKVEVRKVRS